MSFLCVEAALFPELTAQGAQGDAPSHAVSYVGSKRKLLDWIVEQIPDGTTSDVDAFSGGSSVGYRLKNEGLAVHANDSLHWPFHIARAVEVNQSETLDEDEIAALCEDNPDAGSFVRDTYKGLFWKPEIHSAIDHVRAIVDE
ncbi:MAG: DNA adenine methylase [Candidatus Delongbacteria bacterium]